MTIPQCSRIHFTRKRPAAGARLAELNNLLGSYTEPGVRRRRQAPERRPDVGLALIV